jgi:hypothetical protein
MADHHDHDARRSVGEVPVETPVETTTMPNEVPTWVPAEEVPPPSG